MNELRTLKDQFDRLTPNQKLVVLAVFGIILFLMRNLLVLFLGLAAIVAIVWFLGSNSTGIHQAFCGVGVCI